MGYGLLLTYGVSRENPCPPSWWTEKCMGYRRLWVIKSMGYGRFDCTHTTSLWRNCLRQTVCSSSYLSDLFYLLTSHLLDLGAHNLIQQPSARIMFTSAAPFALDNNAAYQSSSNHLEHIYTRHNPHARKV